MTDFASQNLPILQQQMSPVMENWVEFLLWDNMEVDLKMLSKAPLNFKVIGFLSTTKTGLSLPSLPIRDINALESTSNDISPCKIFVTRERIILLDFIVS